MPAFGQKFTACIAILLAAAVLIVAQPAVASVRHAGVFTATVPTTAVVGQSVPLTATFRIAKPGRYLLDVELKNAAGTTMAQWHQTQSFPAATTKKVRLYWSTRSLAPGTYSVAQGIYTPDWHNLSWTDESARLELTKATTNSHVFGAYVQGSPFDGMKAFNSVEAATGRNLPITQWFADWSTPFDASAVEAVVKAGGAPLIAWEPENVDINAISSGKYDNYLKTWATQAKASRTTIYLRPFPEMNGNWATWNGNPAANVAAWRYVVTLFRNQGATNVKWVWSPNETDEPDTNANRMELYYPGSSYVDILAFDAYNWGADGPNGWRSFDQVIGTVYQRVAALGPQPIWITEIASSPVGGNKATWISNMFTSASKYPRLQGIIWFDENKEQDWRLTADPADASAVRSSISHWVS